MMRAAVNLALLSVMLELMVSGNVLTHLEDPYVMEGGSPFWKIHPGAYLSYAAGLALGLARLLHRGRLGTAPLRQDRLILGTVCLLACVVYEVVLTGIGNPIVLIDTFLPGCMVTFVFATTRQSDLARLRRVLLVGFAVNAVLALGESAAGAHMLTPLVDGHSAFETRGEFRAVALYDHPLTGAAASVIGLLMAPCLRGNMLRLAYGMLMGAALIAFGGRVALATAALILLGQRAVPVLHSVLSRQPSALFLLTMSALAGLLFGTVGAALLVGIETRLQSHLYWDSSAQVRLAQWHLLGLLDTSEWLFGCSRGDLLQQVQILNLSLGVPVIENFWLLMFATLGLLGFPLFLSGFLGLLSWHWDGSGVRGRTILAATIMIASGSNSLARKSPLLLLAVAAVASISRVGAPRCLLEPDAAAAGGFAHV
jgi:hypothetical protein